MESEELKSESRNIIEHALLDILEEQTVVQYISFALHELRIVRL